MSKPTPITYSLANWSIRYDPKDFEGVYEVSVTWSANVADVKPARHHRNFNMYADAVKWIEAETETTINKDEL